MTSIGKPTAQPPSQRLPATVGQAVEERFSYAMHELGNSGIECGDAVPPLALPAASVPKAADAVPNGAALAAASAWVAQSMQPPRNVPRRRLREHGQPGHPPPPPVDQKGGAANA